MQSPTIYTVLKYVLMKRSSLSLGHMYPIKKNPLQVVSLHLVLIKKRGLPSYPSKNRMLLVL